jgi:transcriptional regulator with XRE-family HTH domain
MYLKGRKTLDDELLGKRVKELRVKNGFSQGALAEECKVSLRTIQRIENSITIPHGYTLSRLAMALHVSPDELVDWSKQEDKGQLNLLNLSGLTLLINPFLGIIIPLTLWITKREKIKHLDETGKKLLNFQITMLIMISLALILFVVTILVFRPDEVIFGSARSWAAQQYGHTSFFTVLATLIFLGCLALYYVYSIIMIVKNSIRIQKELPISYKPTINFIK